MKYFGTALIILALIGIWAILELSSDAYDSYKAADDYNQYLIVYTSELEDSISNCYDSIATLDSIIEVKNKIIDNHLDFHKMVMKERREARNVR